MTIESREQFELCKQVYEATGWKDTYSRIDDGNHTMRNDGNEVLLGTKQVPLYTSDYLLEKLPERVNRGVLVLTNGERPHAGYAQNDQYGDPSLSRGFYERAEYSDTPLKALLKLTLKLHEEEIL